MPKVTLELIQELRNRTGMGMLDCKNALVETDGNIEAAIDTLRKKGMLIAAKRSGNKTAEGLIHAYIHPGSRIGVLLELNCETDFVARTDELKKFAADVCLHIAAMNPMCLSPEEVDPKLLREDGNNAKLYSEVCLMQQSFVKNDKLTIDQLLKEIIGKIGENIVIRRFTRYEVGA